MIAEKSGRISFFHDMRLRSETQSIKPDALLRVEAAHFIEAGSALRWGVTLPVASQIKEFVLDCLNSVFARRSFAQSSFGT
jgi:hypothetical protein